MRLVLDTNIIISAFINPRGKPSHIVNMVLGRRAELCCNPVILSEYEGVALRPKFAGLINAGHVRRFIELLKNTGFPFTPASISRIPFADESDRIFFDTAKESGSFLISGNMRHFPPEPFVMSPSDFLDRFNLDHLNQMKK